MSTIHIRVPTGLKKAAQEVAEANGLDLSTCIRMFLKHMEVRGALPMSPLTLNGLTEPEESEILARSRGPVVAVRSVKEALSVFRSA